MKKLTSNEMRNIWYEFWRSKNHEIIPSASLIPNDDPTLLWINAGVTPLKKYFDGSIKPNNKRLANSQKCIRTNDIENVGKTARHQTFFEMLGNFSIGDYFRKEAIEWSYEFLTKYLEMDKENLYVTIYKDDEESYQKWIEVGIAENHIIRLESNYWEIGPGPSGPDSEIFYDRGEKYDPENKGILLLEQEIENDRYIEIWNNVFSQYNAVEGVPKSEYKELPNKNIDTGMGLERMCCVLQGVETNFDTDLFIPIMNKIEELSNKKYDGSMAFKLIADHARALTFALSDGANFGNTGRDYVLRRLLRRAVRYGRILDIKGPFMSQLVDAVVEIMSDAYPELNDNIDKIKYKINQEEALFSKTLINGEKKLQEIFKNNSTKKISGEESFRLYDTYGFPFELTEEYALENGFTVSREEFNQFMKQQQTLASSSRKKISSMNTQNENLLNFNLESKFVGYEQEECSSKIIAIYQNDKFVDEATGDCYIVLDKTPFYVESGGQVSDSGTINSIEVLALFKGPNNQIFHQIITDKTIKVNDTVETIIDKEKRSKIRKNHSAVHLLQKALQQLLSEDVHQMGSYVDEERFRFDFRYDYKISKKQIIEIETLVNEKINQNIDTKTEIMSIEEAKNSGAMALFSDKYGNEVRVVSIGDSKELCGGTHVKNTKDIERFAIGGLDSKGSNVYRVEGSTSNNIEKILFEVIKPYNEDMMKLLEKAKKIIEEAKNSGIELQVDYELFNINNDAPHNYNDILFNLNEVNNIKATVQALDKTYQEAKTKEAINDLDKFEQSLEIINNINTIILEVKNYDNKVLKEVLDKLENKYDNSLIFIANINENNVNFLAKSSKNLSFDVGHLVKTAANKAGGNGGGSKTFAQGGGSDITNIDKILEAIKLVVTQNEK